MKKFTKIGILSLALMILTTVLFAKADTPTLTKKVSLILSDGNNTCTSSDYQLGTKTVSANEQQVDPDNHDASCTILKSSAHHITIQLENLSNGSQIIEATNFTGVISNVVLTGSLTTPMTPTFNLGNGGTVYTKAANQVGIWTGNLLINGKIPGGKPAGTYTGALNISVVAG